MHKHIFSFLLITTLLAMGITGCSDDDSTPGTQTVATPVFSPSGGTYTEPTQVTITTTTSNAVIYYTLDGTDPTIPFGTAQEYSTALTIDTSKTIKAYAILTNYTDSAIASMEYSLHYSPTNHFTWSETGGEVTITKYTYTETIGMVYIPAEIAGVPVTAIGDNAFQGNRAHGIIIPDSVRTIGEWAFAISYNLTNVSLPASLTSIGELGFYECQKLISITLPAGLTHIGDSAFRVCKLFTALSIPASVSFIGDSICHECPALTAITVDAANTHYKSVDGVLFSADGTLLLQYPLAKSVSVYAIPAGVETVGTRAYDGCGTLVSVSMPDSLVMIGEAGFSGCSSLEGIVWSANLSTLGDYAFYNTGLTNITLPAALTTIGEQAFVYCTNLAAINVDPGNIAFSGPDGVLLNAAGTTLITYPTGKTDATYSLPPGVETITRVAFAYNTHLTGVTIPATVTSIGNAAFYQCTNLISVTVEATSPPTLEGAEFTGNASNRKIYVPGANVGDYQTAWSVYSADIEAIP